MACLIPFSSCEHQSTWPIQPTD